MAKAALVIMAAGLGSRYSGGIKQMERVGPAGEILMDYAIRDALAAGFDKIVFIIRKELDQEFRAIIGDRISKITEVCYAYQELNDLPAGFTLPDGRTKPWGTGHAILCAGSVISEPFVVINADDYYGASGFQQLYRILTSEETAYSGIEQIAMAAFVLGNTLSEHGGVTRGLVSIDESGELCSIKETKNIRKKGSSAVCVTDDGEYPLDSNQLVSMNMWGFFPSFIDELSRRFPAFLEQNIGHLKSEFLLPEIVDQMVEERKAAVTVVRTDDQWFGMTYAEDRVIVKNEITRLIEAGRY